MSNFVVQLWIFMCEWAIQKPDRKFGTEFRRSLTGPGCSLLNKIYQLRVSA
ncbi:unnamed protein product [Sphacelaria rigidula]